MENNETNIDATNSKLESVENDSTIEEEFDRIVIERKSSKNNIDAGIQSKAYIDKVLIKVIRTGSVIIGSKNTIESASNAKLVILASNCPKDTKLKIEQSGTTILDYLGTNTELGAA
ncbi:MAG: hypothetical protein HF967_03880, partial [Methanosarcinales archaeon]|nr:hypothetical protein [Methanosarcinales archaeon]